MPKQVESKFLEPFRLLHDGLGQTSTRQVTYANDMHEPTIVKVRTTLPPFVLPEYWSRFQLSQEDVYELAKFIDARVWWLSCLVHGCEVSAACIRPSFARVDEVLVSSRLDAIRILMDMHPKVFQGSKDAVLDTTSAASRNHIPPLPARDIQDSSVSEIKELLHPKLKAFEVGKVKGLYEWNNKKYLPVQMEGEHNIYLQRATDYENFEHSRKRQKFGCATVPFVVQTPDGKVHALCEEGVLLAADVS